MQKNFIDLNYIEVIGKAEKEVTPNEIYLKVLINEKDNKGKESLEKMESKMIEKLSPLGIVIDKQLRIKDLASNFQSYFLFKTDVFASKEFEILVYNASDAGKIIMELQTVGISNISIDRVDHSQIEKLKLEVKRSASHNAKIKAAMLADAVDQTIGRAIHITEFENPQISHRLMATATAVSVRTKKSKDTTPEIEFEKIKLTSRIQIKFELK